MSLPTRSIAGGIFYNLQGAPLAYVAFNISLVSVSNGSPLSTAMDASTGDVITGQTTLYTDANGQIPDFALWPNNLGAVLANGASVITQYACQIEYPGCLEFFVSVPNGNTEMTWLEFMESTEPFNAAEVVAIITGIGAAINFADNEIPSGTIDGSNPTFTLAHSPIDGSLHLFLGLRQTPGVDFTISGNTITYAIPPTIGANHVCDYRY